MSVAVMNVTIFFFASQNRFLMILQVEQIPSFPDGIRFLYNEFATEGGGLFQRGSKLCTNHTGTT